MDRIKEIGNECLCFEMDKSMQDDVCVFPLFKKRTNSIITLLFGDIAVFIFY